MKNKIYKIEIEVVAQNKKEATTIAKTISGRIDTRFVRIMEEQLK